MGNAIQVTSLYSVGCCDLKCFWGGWGRHLFKVVLSVRYKFYTKTSEKREVSQDLQDGFHVIAMITAIIEEKKSSAIILIMETTLQRLQ